MTNITVHVFDEESQAKDKETTLKGQNYTLVCGTPKQVNFAFTKNATNCTDTNSYNFSCHSVWVVIAEK